MNTKLALNPKRSTWQGVNGRDVSREVYLVAGRTQVTPLGKGHPIRGCGQGCSLALLHIPPSIPQTLNPLLQIPPSICPSPPVIQPPRGIRSFAH